VRYKFKIKYKSKKQYNKQFYKLHSTCIVQSKITHIEMTLKTIIYPNASNVKFNGNTSQWFSEMGKMMYKCSPKQNIW